MFVSTPNQENVTCYVNVDAITVAGQDHEVSAHVSAPDATCKKAICGIPLSDIPEDNDRKIISARNPFALGAKRMKSTGTILVLFDENKVTNYVSYGGILIKCTLYRQQVDVCCACGGLGHHSGVYGRPTLLCAGLAEKISSKKIMFAN
ncbi:hypothetical protein HPB50_016223 [Hyalomma asiaticum]|uniref:Uncharacterized protein n=1 Tax=Hyalomma asiaticum TaxID=266040 RepID=A0ACB7S7F1_HYAAI|nr:hypothetical protein HPB50_016223 [Hyalomma asiaticum]